MISLILLLSILILVAGLVLLVKPDGLITMLEDHADQPWLQVLAVVVRLLFGYLLISQSQHSLYPLAVSVIGWIALGAAVVLALMGRARFKSLMLWVVGMAGRYARLTGLLATVFGGFLIHAFL